MKGLLIFVIILLSPSVFGQETQELLEFIKGEKEKIDLPNTIVIWAKEGEVVFESILGDPDLQDHQIVDPQRSLFRVGSISKPFTAMAALSMVQDGLIDLNDDVNQYFEEPLFEYKFGEPITIRHLITHTAGFDDFYINKSARTKEDVVSLEHSVRTLMPEQVTIPGQVCSYSNFGVALLGLILEKVEKGDFSEIIKERVFVPLGMDNSTFEPERSDYPNILKAWIKNKDGLQLVPYDYIKDAPAGQMLSTVNDITRFMKFITSLDSLTYFDKGIAEIFRKSIELHFTHHPNLGGGLGALWTLTEYNGYDVVMHDGGYVGVMSRLFYIPKYNQSLFIFGNLMDFRFVNSVTDRLMTTFLPPPEPKASTSEVTSVTIQDDLSINDFTGYYRSTRYSRHSMLKIGVITGLGGEMRLRSDNNYLLMPDHRGQPRRLVRTDTLLFSSMDDEYRMAFRAEDDNITHVFTSGTSALEKISFLESRVFNTFLLSISVLLFLIFVVTGIVRLIISKIRKQELVWSWSFKLVFLLSLFYTLQIILLFIGGILLEPYELEIGFGYGVPSLFYWANAMPIIAIFCTILLSYNIISKTNSRSNTVIGIIYSLVSIAYFISLFYWNLVGWYF